jgi:aryl-alcohol dehydrogenase-like predicted oxidoreductase
MQYRPFGSTGLSVSELGFGCARIGGVFHGSSRSDIQRLLRRAFDAGITVFDTADMYTQGESERLIGETFRDVRQHIVIATKGGYKLPAQKQLIARIKPLLKPIVARLGVRSPHLAAGLRGAITEQDFAPDYLVRAVEASLRRLRTDHIDVYQLHSPPSDVLESGEFVGVLESLRRQGKVRHWGVACDSPQEALAALRLPGVQSIQVGLSALEQAALDAAIPTATQRGVAVIARQVFASGLLTRSPETVSVARLDDDPTVAWRKHEQLRAYASIVERCGRSRAALALQFALAQPGISTVLVGFSQQDQLDEVLRTLKTPALSPQESDLLAEARRAGR